MLLCCRFSVWLIWILASPSCSALLFLALRVLLWLLCLLWWDVKLELNPSNRTIKVDTESKGNKKSFIWSQETRLNVKIRSFTLFYESKFANWSKAMLHSNFLCLIVTENFMSSLRLLRLPLTAVLCFMRENLDFLFVWHEIIFTKNMFSISSFEIDEEPWGYIITIINTTYIRPKHSC